MIQHAVFRGPSRESPRPPGVFRPLPDLRTLWLEGRLARGRIPGVECGFAGPDSAALTGMWGAADRQVLVFPSAYAKI